MARAWQEHGKSMAKRMARASPGPSLSLTPTAPQRATPTPSRPCYIIITVIVIVIVIVINVIIINTIMVIMMVIRIIISIQ